VNFSGDGPKLVRELFLVAEENAPFIMFIFFDEIDAIGTKRYGKAHTSGGEKEEAKCDVYYSLKRRGR